MEQRGNELSDVHSHVNCHGWAARNFTCFPTKIRFEKMKKIQLSNLIFDWRTPFCLLFFSLQSIFIQAQTEVSDTLYNRSIGLQIDNDAFLATDAYYTAGIELEYRHLVKENSWLHSAFGKPDNKLTLAYCYGFKMFTPFEISEEAFNEGRQDRPFAGIQYINSTLSYFPKLYKGHEYSILFGTVGERAGMDNLQRWFHRVANTLLPFGWENQIRNEWVIDLQYKYWHEISLGKAASIIGESTLRAGTAQSYINQDLLIRAGTFSPLQYTAFGGSRLGKNSDMISKEDYAFFGLGFTYVLHNIFIEGSLFDNPSPFTAEAHEWLFSQQFGFQYTYKKTAYRFVLRHLSTEVIGGKQHFQMYLKTAFRF